MVTVSDIVKQRLVDAARQARRQAYAPYSSFFVGAAVLDENGEIHAGCNVENAAYPEGLCAEAGALSAMVLGGGRRAQAVVVVGVGPSWISPCGGCRQKLREFCDEHTPIYTANENDWGPVYTLMQLLPESFGPEHLNTD